MRRQDLRCRIDGVRIRTAELVVVVQGQLAGVTVELAGEQPGPTELLAAGTSAWVRLPLPPVLRPNSWVLARVENRWLDRRFVTSPVAAGGDDGVVLEVEPTTRVEALIAAGEGPGVEFKEELPADHLKVMKTVAAFANGDGGHILIGVSDDGTVPGLSALDAGPQARDQLVDLVKAWVHPLVDFTVDAVPIDPDRSVLVLTIQPGQRQPYGAGTDPTDLRYYVRRGGTTSAVRPDDIRALVAPPPTYTEFGRGGFAYPR